MKLAGRSALITGASQGLGEAIARAFLREGASVFLCARDGKRLETVRRGLSADLGPKQKVSARVADVSDADSCRMLAAAVVREFPDLSVLVNNAGVYGPKGRLEEGDWNDWISAVRINLLGTACLCKEFLPHFRRRGYGKIINLSGGGATQPLPFLSAYAASKAAVVRLTETLAHETHGAGIDINAVAPGALNTRLLDEVIAAGPEKVGAAFHERAEKQKAEGGTPLETGAALCVFLASAESDGISGRLISAAWDPWPTLAARIREIASTDIYTLRRIVPEDRGKKWDPPR